MTQQEEQLFAVRWCLARAAEHVEKSSTLASPVEHPLDLVVNGVNITRTILDVLDMIDPARTKAAVSGDWIPVTERLPETPIMVILADAETVNCGWFYKPVGWSWAASLDPCEPTHWMPLPAPPCCTDQATPSGKTTPD